MERKKQSSLKKASSFTRVIISILLIAFILLFFMSKISLSTDRDYILYEVQENDRIWNIALEFQDDEDIRDLVYHIIDINDIDGDIFPGDVLKIPQ